jgi:hypothetical protein
MPDLVAIIAKGVFEQAARATSGLRPPVAVTKGKLLGLGAVLPMDRYLSKNKGLTPLAQGGRLVLVTVRPPNERLWLVAILDNPVFGADMWKAAPNVVPITDISALRKTIKLATGKGLSQDKGALGMSLQTPRALAPEDMEAILAALADPADLLAAVVAALPATVGPATRDLAEQLVKAPDDEGLRERVGRRLLAEGAADAAKKVLAPFKRFNEHEEGGLPCLCKKCIGAAPEEVTVSGLVLGRDFVCKMGRMLHFWAPREVLAGGADAQSSVRAALGRRLRALAKARKQRARMRAR